MKESKKKYLLLGFILSILFVIWTILVQIVDVKPVGQYGTDIGFSTINYWFHNLTGVSMKLYAITDWMGLLPIFICLLFAILGFYQLVKRKSFYKVDVDIIILGVYYIIIILCYSFFEVFSINYRPILINGTMETSYPSSTTLLVLTVMSALVEQINRRCPIIIVKNTINIFSIFFSVFMVFGRLISGVHWFTDIIGSVLLSGNLFYIYKGLVLSYLN